MITVHDLPDCSRCRALEKFLVMEMKAFKTMDMASSESRATLLLGGFFTLEAPVLQIEDKFYGPELFEGTMLKTKLVRQIMEDNGA